jgi:hypothetical protein
MFKLSRNQIAAGLTVVGLAALTAVAMGAQNSQTAQVKPKARPVLVRTVVVHRTVRVTRNMKPKKVKGAVKPTTASATPPSPSAIKVSAPASSNGSSSYKPASKPKPVQSSTSGYGGGSGSDSDDGEEEDHENEDRESEDDESEDDD